MLAMRRGAIIPFVVALSLVASPAVAQAPAGDLMARLAHHAAGFESMRTHASYAIDGRLERLDGDGHADSLKEMQARVEADGHRAHLHVLHYVEDGDDKTTDLQKKTNDQEADKEKDRARGKKDENEIRMPFLTSEQPRYTFDEVERDRADPARVRIAFVPKEADDGTIEGSAWVDTRSGTLLSAGFKISKTSLFVDYVHITLEFGAPTPLGPAISKVTMEGKGGVLFLRKRFRAFATISDYRISP